MQLHKFTSSICSLFKFSKNETRVHFSSVRGKGMVGSRFRSLLKVQIGYQVIHICSSKISNVISFWMGEEDIFFSIHHFKVRLHSTRGLLR